MLKNIEIITIGDEILTGQIVNSNASFVADRLTISGIVVGWMTTVGDNRQQILHAFRRAKARAGAVIITGGLGPTPDDLTKSCLVEFFKDELEFRQDLLEKVEERFRDMGKELPPLSRNQAEFPALAGEIPNPNGTATGILYTLGKQQWFSLPGVPAEMRHMIDDYVLPRLRDVGFAGRISVRVFKTYSVGESVLVEKLTKLAEIYELVSVAFLPKYYGVDVKLTASGENRLAIDNNLDAAEKLLLHDIEPYVFGRDEDTLPEIVGRSAIEKGLKIAVAESCTGGLIAKLFTDIPGSSAFFDQGIVTYSNDAKMDLLGISEELILKHGAVSQEVAEAMAGNLLEKSNADVTASVTGIAGPTGSTAEKPVGLVYVGIADSNRVEVTEFRFKGNREMNRNRAAMNAIWLLHERIKKLDSRR